MKKVILLFILISLIVVIKSGDLSKNIIKAPCRVVGYKLETNNNEINVTLTLVRSNNFENPIISNYTINDISEFNVKFGDIQQCNTMVLYKYRFIYVMCCVFLTYGAILYVYDVYNGNI